MTMETFGLSSAVGLCRREAIGVERSYRSRRRRVKARQRTQLLVAEGLCTSLQSRYSCLRAVRPFRQGFMPTFYIQQFGCRATQADGAALERQLLQRGCTSARDASSADIVVMNTCTVTASADAQARDAIRKLHAANPGVRVVVTGCYAQRAPEELSQLPGVAWVVGNSHKPQIPELIETISSHPRFSRSNAFLPLSAISPVSQPELRPPAEILIGDIFEQQTLLTTPVFGGEGNHTRPTLKIQDGCNSRCSFCVIPFVRGRSRSLPPEDVIGELQRLSEAGYREIVLSGINLGTYDRDL